MIGNWYGNSAVMGQEGIGVWDVLVGNNVKQIILG